MFNRVALLQNALYAFISLLEFNKRLITYHWERLNHSCMIVATFCPQTDGQHHCTYARGYSHRCPPWPWMVSVTCSQYHNNDIPFMLIKLLQFMQIIPFHRIDAASSTEAADYCAWNFYNPAYMPAPNNLYPIYNNKVGNRSYLLQVLKSHSLRTLLS